MKISRRQIRRIISETMKFTGGGKTIDQARTGMDAAFAGDKFGRGDLPKRPQQPSFGLNRPEDLPSGNFLDPGEIQGEHPYDVAKNEVADRFREMDAVDEVLSDIMRLLGLTSDNFVNREEVEELSEVIDMMVQYDESLDSILRAIPDHIKDILVRF